MIISLIVVIDTDNGIGKDNKLLCHLPADLKYFKQVTSGHHIVMGRKTFESVGRPLPNRTNIVVSGTVSEIPGCVVVKSVEEAIRFAHDRDETELFITGGGIIFTQSMPIADRIYLTEIDHSFEADTFFPSINKAEWRLAKNEPHQADEKNPFNYSFLVYDRVR